MAKDIKKEDIIKSYMLDSKKAKKTFKEMCMGDKKLKIQYILCILFKILIVVSVCSLFFVLLSTFPFEPTEKQFPMMFQIPVFIIVYLMCLFILFVVLVVIRIIFVWIFNMNYEILAIKPNKYMEIHFTNDRIGISNQEGSFIIRYDEIERLEMKANYIEIFAPYSYVGQKLYIDSNSNYKTRGVKYRVEKNDSSTPSLKIFNYYNNYEEIINYLKEKIKI